MVEFIFIACFISGIIAVILMIKLVLPMRKPTTEEMTAYIQKMEKGGKLK